MRLLALSLASTAILLVAGAGAEGNYDKYVQPLQVVKDITKNGLLQHLEALEKIAGKNGGNRAFGTPGYKASVDYVLGRARSFRNSIDIKTQEFSALYSQTNSISVTESDQPVHVVTSIYNHPTPPEGITAPVRPFVVDDVRGSGCFEDQWTGINATGTISLIKQGVCPVANKLRLAKVHGAQAAIIYHHVPGTLYGGVTLGAVNVGLLVPTGIIPLEIGNEWIARVAAGEEVVATLRVDSFWEQRKSWNIIAETKQGNPNNIIMMGAHLDSVQAGPGINDDASGCTALLEMMASLLKYRVKNKVRFALWGGEESGLLGSNYYTSLMSPEDAAKIRVYNNYDLISAIDPVWGVLRGDEYSSQLHFDYIVSQGIAPYFGGFAPGSSDYQGFLNLNVSSSGLYAGVDPCYHSACDTVENINLDVLLINARAAAFSMATMAVESEAPARRKRDAMQESLHPFGGCEHEP